MRKGLLTLGILLCSTSLSAATADYDALFNMPLQELLKIKIDTASVKATEWTNQPATITLYDRAGIERMGARNLMDILEQVPGVSFGVDVFGVTSLIFRGQWAHEGKVLLLLDDLPINDMLYGSLNLARHYPASQIDRVEVLRGAGAAKYGGNAQLAVIRIYSRVAQTTGVELDVAGDQIEDAGIGSEVTTTASYRSDDVAAGISTSFQEGDYSGEQWRDATGTDYDLEDSTGIKAYDVIGKVDWRGLQYRLFYDAHFSDTPQKFGVFKPGEQIEFSSTNWSLAYDWQIADNWVLTPRYVYRRQNDWFIDRNAAINPTQDFFLPVERNTGELDLEYSGKNWDLLNGLEYNDEEGRARSPGGAPTNQASTYFNGKPSVGYTSKAAFSQLDYRWERWLTSLGVRYSDHSYAGTSLVPRSSVVYQADEWHLKAVYGQAFREPNIDVIRGADTASGEIDPELTTQQEIELGWQAGKNWFGTVAVFNMRIEEPTIYSSSTATNEFFYRNNEPTETRGLETQWNGRFDGWGAQFSYSYYQVAGDAIEPYAVEGEKSHLGAPQHKLAAQYDKRIANNWQFLTTAVWYSTYYARDWNSNISDLDVIKQDEQLIGNVMLRYTLPDMQISAGIYDVFSEGRRYPQPYAGEDSSTPYDGAGRQLRLAWNWRWQ